MFNTRSILIALVAATAITGISVAFDEPAGTKLAGKDQSRLNGFMSIPSIDGTITDFEFEVVRSGKSDGLMAGGACDSHNWPYVPTSCLVVAGGDVHPRPMVRTVTVEHPTETGSALVRMPVTQVAAQ